MIFHPRFEALYRFAAHERGGSTVAHLARCTACRETVGWIRDVQGTLRGEAPVRAPAGSWDAIQTRLESGDSVLLPAEPTERSARAVRRVPRAVAAALLVITCALAAAVPGSPVRTWLREVLLGEVAGTAAVDDRAAVFGDDGAPATFVIAPDEGSVLIEVVAPDPAVRLRVRVVDAAELTVRAEGGAARARFASAAGRLTIAEAGAGDIRLDIPRAARSTTVVVDGRRYLVHESGELSIFLPADTVGAEIVLPIQR